MAMAVIRKVGADLWRHCFMNMSKHRENRVSGVIAWGTGVESFTRMDLSLRIRRHRCLYTTRDARKQGERALMRQMTVS